MARTGRDSRALPTGTLTFLFSDIEGSTRLVAALGPRYTTVLERHQAILRTAFDHGDGVEVATEGDSFFVVFRSAPSAVTAAAAAQRGLAGEPWPAEVGSLRVRMGLHTGEASRGGDNYVGLDVHRAARISAAAHGGQVLMSDTTRALAAGSLPPADLRFLDLGEYRLKDLERPERLIELVVPGLQEEFAPPRTLEAPSNLPALMTSFVGREREVDEVAGLVRRSRLVTLIGPGGSGKTRLGLRVADGLRLEFEGGTFFIDLSTIDDAELVPTTIAHAVGLREEAQRPLLESLKDHLRDLRLLLLLDNFEQVMAGAPLVGDLLRAAPSIAILVTSRAVLHLSGEQEYTVPPLDTPDPRRLPPLGELTRYDAVGLFMERARQVRPDFQVDAGNASAVAAICARLDGLPLAIELAAARVEVLAPDAILARLDKRLALLTSSASDLPARQRTLRGAIDWSHDLLDPSERLLFRRLSVFVGGSTIDDAQAGADPHGETGTDMLDGLASLMDKSLLRQSLRDDGEARFGMLESIHEYALERLTESEDLDPTRARYEDHFAQLTARAEPGLLGPKAKAWLDRLDAERDNLRAATQYAADDGRLDVALEMAAAQWRFWQQRGHLAEGRLTLEGLLGRATPGPPRPEVRAKALAGLGGVTYWQGDFAAAGRAYTEALGIERTLADPAGLAEALYNAGFVAAVSGDRGAARADYEESLALYQGLGEQLGVVKLREALAFLLFHEGDFDGSRTLQEENLRVAREGGEPFRIANALNQLLAVKLKQPDLRGAHDSGAEALRVFRSSDDMHGVIRVLILCAAVAVAEGDPGVAAQLCGLADLLKEPLGNVATPMQILGIEDPAEASRELLGDEAFRAAYQAGRELTLDEAIDLVGT